MEGVGGAEGWEERENERVQRGSGEIGGKGDRMVQGMDEMRDGKYGRIVGFQVRPR